MLNKLEGSIQSTYQEIRKKDVIMNEVVFRDRSLSKDIVMEGALVAILEALLDIRDVLAMTVLPVQKL